MLATYTMNVRFLKLSVVGAAAFFVAIVAFTADSPDEPAFAKFKAKMLPQVGHEIAAVGKLDSGKAGWWLSFDDWGLDIEATTTNQADLTKLDALGQFRLHTVKVVGVLRYQKEWKPDNPMAQGIPEGFFFDVAKVAVTDLATNGSPKPQDK